jgi:hypothetical protein
MYAASPTWIENGPGRRRAFVPVPAIARTAARRALGNPGLGELPEFLKFSPEYCKSGWSWLNPLTIFGGCQTTDMQSLADAYGNLQYGDMPLPVPPPAPGVTLTTAPAAASLPNAAYAGVSDGLPVYAVPSTALQNVQAATAQQNAAIDQAIGAGYNPAGNFPVNAIDLANFWATYKTPLIVAGVALAGFALWKGVTR